MSLMTNPCTAGHDAAHPSAAVPLTVLPAGRCRGACATAAAPQGAHSSWHSRGTCTNAVLCAMHTSLCCRRFRQHCGLPHRIASTTSSQNRCSVSNVRPLRLLTRKRTRLSNSITVPDHAAVALDGGDCQCRGGRHVWRGPRQPAAHQAHRLQRPHLPVHARPVAARRQVHNPDKNPESISKQLFLAS
jgi:hypothetical protein